MVPFGCRYLKIGYKIGLSLRKSDRRYKGFLNYTKKDYVKIMGFKGKISLIIYNILVNYFARVVPDYV